jgi:hypothetical protein
LEISILLIGVAPIVDAYKLEGMVKGEGVCCCITALPMVVGINEGATVDI